MAYEVVVVGGGIGGLTTAALLSARGLDVCLLERESQPGGCAANFTKLGYSFEGGAGLYPLWQPGELHDRVFAELPVEPPEVRALDPAYVVRLPDASEVPVTADTEEFEENLRSVFPECAAAAVAFYREADAIGNTLLQAAGHVPDLNTSTARDRIEALLPKGSSAAQILRTKHDPTVKHLELTSARFQRFIDLQLQLLAQAPSEECHYLYACVALSAARQGMFAIRGGGSGLAERLAAGFKKSGGRIRLDTPVLRLAFDSAGCAIGVDLLSGETVTASRAIVSNLTVWDTYGKLIGLGRTPKETRKQINDLRGWGAYLIFAGMEESTAAKLGANHTLALTGWQEAQLYDPEAAQFTFAVTPAWDPRGPAGKRAVTVHAFTDVNQWFTFHEDEMDHEEMDQSALEAFWQRLHQAMPELGDTLEVIDTATPRTFYDLTRRKLGLVGGVASRPEVFGPGSIGHRTSLPNVFMVGDTTFPGAGVAAVTQSGLIVANEIAPRR